MDKKIVIYIIATIVVLVAVFFSQQAYSRDIFKNVLSYMSKYGGASLMGAFNANSSNDPETNSPNDLSQNSSTDDNSVNIASANSTSPYETTTSAYSSLNDKIAPGVNLSITEKLKMAISSLSENVTNGVKSGGEVCYFCLCLTT